MGASLTLDLSAVAITLPRTAHDERLLEDGFSM
jgi:hypothetical protein